MDNNIPITLSGLNKIKQKIKILEKEQQENITEIQVARSYGDLRENAEYHHAKEKQSLIELRLAQLNEVLQTSQVVDITNTTSNKVQFGATISYQFEGQTKIIKWQIVGPAEADSDEGTISISSPIAKALLGKELGDIVEVQTPGGKKEIEIIKIEYI